MGTSHAQYSSAGTGFRYSNTDYALLGLVIEAASGAKLGATFFSGEETLVGAAARGFVSVSDVTDTVLSYATWAADPWSPAPPPSPAGAMLEVELMHGCAVRPPTAQ